MACLLHNYYTRTITHNLHSANQCLPDQNPCDGEPDCLWEMPAVLDEEAEAAYKGWQESLSYLQEDIERL